MIDPESFRTALQSAQQYADRILSEPLRELGGILADQIGFWRLKNRVNILVKAREYIRKRGIDPVPILPDVFVPIMEAGGNTADETISDMFARLLATGLDPNEQHKLHPSFAWTVGQLSPLDATIIQIIEDETRKLWGRNYGKPKIVLNVAFFRDELQRRSGTRPDPTPVNLSLANLERLGVCSNHKESYSHDPFTFKLARPYAYIVAGDWNIATYGRRLLSAIAKERPYWRDVADGDLKKHMKQAKATVDTRRRKRAGRE